MTAQTEDRQRLPASEQVRKELLSLRVGDGISASRMKEARLLKLLPATSDQLAQREYALTDRHIAAYDVLNCTVKRLGREKWVRVASVTLNLTRQEGNLSMRKAGLRTELLMGENSLDGLVGEVYEEISTDLVRYARTPCAPSNSLQDEYLEKISRLGIELAGVLTDYAQGVNDVGIVDVGEGIYNVAPDVMIRAGGSTAPARILDALHSITRQALTRRWGSINDRTREGGLYLTGDDLLRLLGVGKSSVSLGSGDFVVNRDFDDPSGSYQAGRTPDRERRIASSLLLLTSTIEEMQEAIRESERHEHENGGGHTMEI